MVTPLQEIMFFVAVLTAEGQIDIFHKITQTRAYQVVIDQLEKAILSGKLKPGQRLPNERELTTSLGTSRRTLREAFRVLEQKGLIEVKLGSKGGTFVADQVQERLGETLSLLVQQQSVSYEELAEFRASTEGTVAALSAKRATEEDFALIGRRILEVEALMEEDILDIQAFVEKEMKLHQTLAQICGNRMYALTVKTVHDLLLRPAFLKDKIDSPYIRDTVENWKKILAAMEKRNSNKAREMMESHVFDFAGKVPEGKKSNA
jgi:GntR family transcriptional regulator, transcriptional repressor for pyruvate dehydrogenase complex